MPNPKAAEPLRAIVIGTGIGGAGIAALLAQAGFDVTVVERNAFAGGTGIGTEMAAESAITVFNIIMRDIESGAG